MKRSFLSVMLFSTIFMSTAAMASNEGNPAGTVIGYVSVTGASTLDEAERALTVKAHKMGGDAIHITSMGSKNKQNATAEVLRK